MAGILALNKDAFGDVVDFLVREQARPERNIAYIGTERDAIAAELADFEPGWAHAAHGVRDDRGRLVALAYGEWDTGLGRLWVHGPWVAGDDGAWEQWAKPVLQAVIAAAPSIADIELSGTIENVRLGALANAIGFERSEPNYVLCVPLDGPTPERDPSVVDATADDLAWITPLHDAEFPATYATPQQLLDGDGVFVAIDHGYAAGRVAPDGSGYIDFVAVDGSARGAGRGRRLVQELVSRLAEAGAEREVCLTVQEHRVAARELYASLGFRIEIVIVGYRRKE
ncbi:MAG TPA: N-acetyltransferase [Acidimicrobiia bacterium]|nr:N-acetyltransferase [Acidimicrobiia bacterium]